MSDEKKLDWFLELEPKLIIDSSVRLREENKLKEQKIKKLETEKDIQLKKLQNEFMRMKFDLADLLRKEGKKSKLNSSLKKYPDLKKHMKYGDDEESIYIKDIDDEEILY